jgi:hypothetical protein
VRLTGDRPVSRARQRLGRVRGQADVVGVTNIGLDHSRVDARRARDKAPLAGHRADDHNTGDLVDDLGAQAADELADRRLVRQPLRQRDLTEAGSCNDSEISRTNVS